MAQTQAAGGEEGRMGGQRWRESGELPGHSGAGEVGDSGLWLWGQVDCRTRGSGPGLKGQIDKAS